MFRLRLHPTPSGFLLGIATVAFWALLWLSVFVQLQGAFQPVATGDALVSMVANSDPTLAVAFDFE